MIYASPGTGGEDTRLPGSVVSEGECVSNIVFETIVVRMI